MCYIFGGRQGVLDMIKHSSLGGGGRDRVAILGLMHKKNVVLLDMQLPSAETMKVWLIVIAERIHLNSSINTLSYK